MIPLPWNAYRCPKDKTVLRWESYAGMRVYQEVRGRKVYNARCPECNATYSQARKIKETQG